MASDGPGKFKEKKNRSSKPYDRPKGIISRVTDTVTGLFSSSWLSGWVAGQEEEEASDSQHAESSQAPSQSNVTMVPPGESFIFAQPATARRSFRPIYPEEGELEGNSQQASGINVGASTSSGNRMNLPTSTPIATPGSSTSSGVRLNMAAATSVAIPNLSSETPTRRHPITARTKSQLEPRSMPLLMSSTPAGDDGSEFSESSADTGVDASVIPRPDERDYQREILQLDEESLQTLRETLAKSAPAPPITQPASSLPSLEETRKRPREPEPDQSSLQAEGSFRSLFSDNGNVSLSQPQPSALASKRPRFNVSSYGSPVVHDRSVLSDSAFKMSPFYPGKTRYGGASNYRSRRLQMRTQTPRVQVKPKQAQTSDDGGLSQSSRRILECLEQMSTPISDAKRIPTPIPGQRGSFLDASSNYVAAYHRPRSSPRKPGPPTSNSSTPIKPNVEKYISMNETSSSPAPSPLVTSKFSISSSVASTSRLSDVITTQIEGGVSSSKDKDGGVSSSKDNDGGVSSSKDNDGEERNPLSVNSASGFSSVFSKAAEEATAKFKPTSTFSSKTSTSSSVFEFGSSTKGTSLPAFEFTPKPPEANAANSSVSQKTAGGKLKSKVVSSGRASNKHDDDEELVEEVSLPSVSLTMSSLPKIDFSTALSTVTPLKVASSNQEGFKFASPEVVHGDKVSSEAATSFPVFTFSRPAAVGRGKTNSFESPSATMPAMPLFNSYNPHTAPKLKEVAKKDKTSNGGELKVGSLLDYLKPHRSSPEKLQKDNASAPAPLYNSIGEKSSTLDTSGGKFGVSTLSGLGSEQINCSVHNDNSVAKKTESSAPQGLQGFSSFMKSNDEWECSVCMIRNKNSEEKCIACQTSKPGLKSNSNSSLVMNAADNPPPPALNSIVSGWGSSFTKSVNEWECDTCMIRNKDSSDKCVACETPKPGSGSNSGFSNSKSGLILPDSKSIESTSEQTTTTGFGAMFAKAKGEWECDTCLVRNKSDATRCVSCETPKPGAVAVSQAITGNFKFGVNSTNDSSVGGSTFKFGVVGGDSSSEVKSSSGFTFGISAKSNEESKDNSNKETGGFKFGVNAEGNSSSLTEKPKENNSGSSATSVSNFSFGVKPLDKKEGDSKVSFLDSKSESASKSEGTNALKTGFSFTPKQDASPFTFGAGLKRKPESKDDKNSSSEIKPASELITGSVADALKENKVTSSPGVFTFGSKSDTPLKNDTNSGASKAPTFGFNNAIPNPLLNDDSSKSIIPTFGTAKVNERATPPPANPLLFGAKTGDSPAAPNSFTFGGDKPKAPQSFSFGSSLNKDEPKPTSVPSFSFGSTKRESGSDEPPKKIPFGGSSSTSSTSLNNNVNAKSSIFTFGSKENSLSTGSGFGAPPTSTPAFGAPAPTCNTTAFQFGNNNNPVPAAAAPAPTFGSTAPAPTFGSAAPAPAFGSNNSTPSFAFGQGAKKNISAGFDFGQVASNTSSQGFNFGGAAAPVFQFGQKPSEASTGFFQFGSGGQGVETPSFGGDNPFTPAPPSGRVVKKARRRKQ